MDLTKIEKPFGLLDNETQAALKAHGGPYEIYIGKDRWGDCCPHWMDAATYRAKPKPQRKTVYPWDALDDRIKWAAVSATDDMVVFESKPKLLATGWSGAFDIISKHTIKFQRGDEPWQETLQCRPGYEGDE